MGWILHGASLTFKLILTLTLIQTLTRVQRAKPLVTAPTVRSKSCSRCLEVKPASEFNINKTTSSGLTSHCKVCKVFAWHQVHDCPENSRHGRTLGTVWRGIIWMGPRHA